MGATIWQDGEGVWRVSVPAEPVGSDFRGFHRDQALRALRPEGVRRVEYERATGHGTLIYREAL